MPVLYFDNFRGFDKTFVPLKNVNFFVGENSTGKTSVLKLIKTISDPRFWFYLEFNSEEAELGYYSEIASFANPQKKYFDIAILGDYRDKDEGTSAIKLRFNNKEGIPRIKEITLINKDLNIQAVFENKAIKYRYAQISLENVTEENKLKYFKRWVSNNELAAKKFEKLETKTPFSHDERLFFALHHIMNAKIKVGGKSVNRSFSIPNFLQDIAWLAPIRTDPKRTYDSYKTTFNPDGTHAPYLLKKLIGKDASIASKEKIEKILKKFGSDSGLFENIIIKTLGRTDTSPFELHILLKQQPLKITNVGYGVSQILPLIVEVLGREINSWFAIQQPEIHLHPKAQAAFGDFIFKAAIVDKKNFVIETHSDYTIDRFRLKRNQAFKKGEDVNIKCQIVFFKKNESKNELVCIPIQKDGSLAENQPSEFRDFFIKEQLDLIQI